jgi:hypothetical protein
VEWLGKVVLSVFTYRYGLHRMRRFEGIPLNRGSRGKSLARSHTHFSRLVHPAVLESRSRSVGLLTNLQIFSELIDRHRAFPLIFNEAVKAVSNDRHRSVWSVKPPPVLYSTTAVKRPL